MARWLAGMDAAAFESSRVEWTRPVKSDERGLTGEIDEGGVTIGGGGGATSAKEEEEAGDGKELVDELFNGEPAKAVGRLMAVLDEKIWPLECAAVG